MCVEESRKGTSIPFSSVHGRVLVHACSCFACVVHVLECDPSHAMMWCGRQCLCVEHCTCTGVWYDCTCGVSTDTAISSLTSARPHPQDGIERDGHHCDE